MSACRTGAPEPCEYGYSPEALAMFPRYHVHHAIQAAVEMFTPADLGPLHEARELLAAAGATADNLFIREPNGEIERRAIGEERELFRDYVQSLTEEDLAQVEPLPFRRTLTGEESASLWRELEERWGVQGGWYPLDPPRTRRRRTPLPSTPPRSTGRSSKGACAMCSRVSASGASGSYGRTGTTRRSSWGILEPVLTGGEGFWLDGSFDWLIYASHEASVTVAGSRLLPALQQAWPAWDRHLYDPSYGPADDADVGSASTAPAGEARPQIVLDSPRDRGAHVRGCRCLARRRRRCRRPPARRRRVDGRPRVRRVRRAAPARRRAAARGLDRLDRDEADSSRNRAAPSATAGWTWPRTASTT